MISSWELAKLIGDVVHEDRDIAYGLQALVHMKSHGVLPLNFMGYGWEFFFAREAARRGFEVEWPLPSKLPYDVLVNGMKVQCKARRTDKSGPVAAARQYAAKGRPFDFIAVSYETFDAYAILPADVVFDENGVRIRSTIPPSYREKFWRAWRVFEEAQK